VSALLRRVAVVTVVGVAALGFGLAHAGSAQAATYTVCGYGVIVPIPGGGSCMSLPEAITAAQTSSGADTIRMLPGDYCPIDLEGNFFSPIKFVGVGFAGVDVSGGPVVFDGPEASLTTFVYNEAFCGSESAAVVEVNGFVSSGAPFTFENLTVDGSGGGSIGMYSPGGQANLTLRDIIVENVTGFPHSAVQFTAGFLGGGQFSSLEIDNSAILNNYNGVVAQSGNDSIYDTTIAGNVGTALSLTNGFDSISGDTIAHNTVGVTPPTFNFQVVDTIVADNVQNCSTTNDWEFPPADSWNNLLESQNSGCQKFDTTDTVVASIPMQAVGLNGGPTPSILPPSDADGHGAAPCGLNGVDQREFLVSGSSCDVGSVQESASGTPHVVAVPLSLGDVDTGATTPGTVEVQSTGGDLVGISSVSVSGTGWAVANDGCTYTLLTHASNESSCAIGLTVTPTANGEHDGELTVQTTAGTLSVDLTSHAVTRATGQDDTYDVADSSLTVPAPGVLGNDEDGVSFDEVWTEPSHGTLTGPLADGSFTYTPDDNFVGNDSFQYTVIGNELAESHPITVTLHVLAFTVQLDAPSYSADPGGTFTLHVTVTPLHGYSGHACLDVADTNGNKWPSYLSPDNNFVDCSATDGTTAAEIDLSGGQVITDIPVDVASDATPGDFPLELLASPDSGPATARTFQLGIGAVNPPVISGFAPVNVGVGTHVKIFGSAFTGTTAVAFNGVAASDFSVDSDSTITAIVAAGTTSGTITVTTPLGSSTSANPYTFFAVPTITSLSVTEAAVGSTVIVNGTSLNGATSVTLEGTHAPFTVVSSAEITFTVPAGATEGPVTVVTPGGTATSVFSVTPAPRPTITSFTPGTGTVGTPVTITGTDLEHTVGIEIGGILTVPTSVSATQVVFSIPPGAISGTIKILATNGSVTSVDTFTITG
jgi:hypothetical protein